MAVKPTEKPGWVSGDEAARIQEPTGSKKLTGFLKNERPPFNFLNWLFNIFSHWLDYFAGNSQYNIIIDSDTDEGDYTSMAAYAADSPSAGDRILTKIDEVLTGPLIFPAGVEFTQQKGKKFTLTANFSPIIQFAANVKTKGDFLVENSNTGTIAKGFSVNGDDNHHDNLVIENASTGTITGAVYIEAGAEGNYGQARSINSGGGAITNDLTDNSGNDENDVTVKGDLGISRSRGAKKFDQPDITDFTNAQHDHGDADDGGNVLSIPTITNFTNAQHDHGDADDGGGILDPIQLKLKKGADVVSASALALGADGNYFDVTGTTSIHSINSIGVGTVVTLHFDDALTLFHDVPNLILPSGRNLKTWPGLELTFIEYAAGDWRLVSSNKIEVDSHIGTFSRDTSLASGQQDINGIGFQPEVLIFFANIGATNRTSWGFDGNLAVAVVDYHSVTPDAYTSLNSSIFAQLTPGNTYAGQVVGVGFDGFSISWTKTGSPTGILTIKYLALK